MYLKIDLYGQISNSINLIINELYKFFNDQFISQDKPEANLGCHPYHITLLGKIQQYFKDSNDIKNFYKYWNKDLYDVCIMPTNLIKITSSGKLLWIVHNNYLTNICYEMCEKLGINPNNNYYANNMHITLGIVKNPKYFNQDLYINDELFNNIEKEYYGFRFGWDY